MSELRGWAMRDDERGTLEQWPVECAEAVTRRNNGDEWQEPCDRVAVAARFDPEDGGAYPVCARHARGQMVTLADLLGLFEFNGGVDTRDEDGEAS